MKKVIWSSLIISVLFTLSGMLTNLISYWKRKELVFYKTISGGEYMGFKGFGIMMHHLFPMSSSEGTAERGKIWLSFNLGDFIKVLLLSYIVAFVICLAIKYIKEYIKKSRA